MTLEFIIVINTNVTIGKNFNGGNFLKNIEVKDFKVLILYEYDKFSRDFLYVASNLEFLTRKFLNTI